MNQLDKDKKTVGPEDKIHLEGFALNVFAKADKQDRAGRACLNTAKTFYAASLFFEVSNQFGPLPPGKQKYAVWKAADIRKALKEGRKPVPGPPGGEEELSVPPNDDYVRHLIFVICVCVSRRSIEWETLRSLVIMLFRWVWNSELPKHQMTMNRGEH